MPYLLLYYLLCLSPDTRPPRVFAVMDHPKVFAGFKPVRNARGVVTRIDGPRDKLCDAAVGRIRWERSADEFPTSRLSSDRSQRLAGMAFLWAKLCRGDDPAECLDLIRYGVAKDRRAGIGPWVPVLGELTGE